MYKILLFLALTGLFACNSTGNSSPKGNPPAALNAQHLEKFVPKFDKDSAFAYLQQQCDFGPRVPNTGAHRNCGIYLSGELKRFGAEVIEQNAALTAYDGTVLQAKNIIGVFYPEKTRRIILFAHWDSRPFCDHDADPANYLKPVMGANDGASGVAVLLEIGRQLQMYEPGVGVDIVFFDAEDYGEPSFEPARNLRDTWCLGSQYWGRNPHYRIKPAYGILLDMVGGRNAEFNKDMVSARMAPDVLDRVWGMAKRLGYGEYFRDWTGASIIDDHVYVNTLTGIPTIDILDFTPERGFPETWHTVNDIPENIDRDMLEIVGNTVMHVIYSE